MTVDDLNGLNVGDLIYNKHHEKMFIIQLFKFEHPHVLVEEAPYILGVSVVVGDKDIIIGEDVVHVSIDGSRRVTSNDVSEMIYDHLTASNNKAKALQRLHDITSA